jgi:hypothetical protein
MSVLKSGVSTVGKMLVVLSLAIAFFVGLLGIVYFQLKGEEVSIPKVVGKNFNDGRSDLSDMGLRIKKVASRYSNEEPNTILEQRPRAGTTAKSGLMISVIVSEKNPDGNTLPVDIKNDDEVIKEIQEQPELKIDKKKTKANSKKSAPKNRDVISEKPADADSSEAGADTGTSKETPATAGSTTEKPAVKPSDPKPTVPKPPVLPKPDAPKPKEPKSPNTSGDSRVRKVDSNNGR